MPASGPRGVWFADFRVHPPANTEAFGVAGGVERASERNFRGAAGFPRLYQAADRSRVLSVRLGDHFRRISHSRLPAITLRDSIERPEALDTGSILMSGLDPADTVRAISTAMSMSARVVPEDYRITNTSERVANFILSTAHRHHQWAGIRLGRLDRLAVPRLLGVRPCEGMNSFRLPDLKLGCSSCEIGLPAR